MSCGLPSHEFGLLLFGRSGDKAAALGPAPAASKLLRLARLTEVRPAFFYSRYHKLAGAACESPSLIPPYRHLRQ